MTSNDSERARPRALFFGTPQFAVPCLDALVDVAEVVCVISQPDRPAGRGLLARPTPVKARAQELGLALMQPVKVRTPEFAAALRAFDADMALVVAYGRILTRAVLEAPRRGCVNVHASLLPRWRGAAPIQWAIAAGDAEAGVCLMEMDEGLDTGPVFARAKTPISENENAVELAARLSAMGADLVRRSLVPWQRGELAATPQDFSSVTIARLLTKEDGFLDFTRSAREVHDRVRGMQPWPGASARLMEPGRPEVRVKIHRTRVVSLATKAHVPGTITGASPEGLEVACGAGRIAIEELQVEGKRRLRAADFLSGRKLVSGARFERES